MSPATFAILSLTALIIISHLAQLVCDLVDAHHGYRPGNQRRSSHIA
jgi:hypothetical protein